jgi:DNA-binding LacI/PurR family transcriptional regulator
MARKGRVTGADVAAAAGVSPATVSYVINGVTGQSIPAGTRQRVLDVARDLGYAPSAAARTLRRGRSDVVVFVPPDWPGSYRLDEFISALGRTLAEHELVLLTYQGSGGGMALAPVWRATSPAAVIFGDLPTEADRRAMTAAGVQTVVSQFDDDPGWQLPNEQVGRLQVAHLAAAGHHRIGYAYPSDKRLRAVFADPRWNGVRAACAERGLPEPVRQDVAPDDPSLGALDAWLSGPAPVTAVCAYNDEIAFAVLAGARAMGFAVPGDLAVIGVDDVPLARLMSPGLTTVRMDGETFGRRVAERVAAELTGTAPPTGTSPPEPVVVARESA